WIDSQTEEEILRGIKEAKPEAEYDSISDSAYLRAKEDYLIGINFSRLLSIIYGNRLAKSLNQDYFAISVGRVMTCVLGMIVSREREIRNFVKTKYYKIIGTFGTEKGNFTAEWKVNEKSKLFESNLLYNESGFKSEEEAKKFIAELAEKEAIVTEIKKTKQKENAPLLFNLAEIQNECTKKFKIKPDETLEVIQTLYEKKLVTYPRTDARVLSTAVSKEISKNLNGLAKRFQDEEIQVIIKKMIDEKNSTNLAKTKYVNDSKITDHYAIIPTGQGFENYNTLNQLQKDIYKLIVKRFLAIFYPPAEYNKVNVTVNIENETFYGTGKVCVKRGFLDVLKPENKESSKKEKLENEENQKEDSEKSDEIENTNLEVLNTLKKKDVLEVQNFELKDAETSPPSRYNSGNLVIAMEGAGKLIEDEELREQLRGAGIGTSATRGEIIKKLERIQYIKINSKTQIVTPTEKGEAIFDVVNQSMPDMLNPKLTASWEKGLEMVAKREIKPEVFMEKLEKYIMSKFNKLVTKY
ncbi:MAG TPA: DNA topoisomerase III, partial [Clostridiales bacterium]|nr:DNA topoisomerase III [Clostridiales bacterium]